MQMTSIDLSGNPLGKEGVVAVSRCIHKIRNLVLVECELHDDIFEPLSNEIAALDGQVRKCAYE